MKIVLNYQQLLAPVKNRAKGFTLLEIMATMSLFLVVVLLTGSLFILAQQSYTRGSAINEITQNTRVTFDRISRELRQAAFLVTDLSATSTEIFFQNGHDTDYISYIHYYLNGDRLERTHKAYYFSPLPSDPSEYVRYNSVDAFGNSAASTTISTHVVGEYFNSIGFSGDNGLITISADLSRKNVNLTFDTKVYIRNW